MNKLYTVPELRGLLPFIRSTYAHPTSYRWQDSVGVTHQVHQAEGGEQGDPLMPLLFSLAIHDALVAVKAELRDGEVLFAFLDDVYAVCGPNRTREVFDLLAHHLWRLLEFACTRERHECGQDRVCLPQTWKTWANKFGTGIKVLGTQVGTDQFVFDERVQEETRL